MKQVAIVLLLLLCYTITTSSSCGKNSDKPDCEHVACTMIFAAVTVKVTDSAAQDAQLDDAYTKHGKTGEIIRHESNYPGGSYVVLDDGYLKRLVNDTATFYFIGIKNGREVINEPYVIGADCCHVRKVSGKAEISLP